MLVRQWMTPNPKTVGPQTNISAAIAKMKEWKIRRLPVINNENVVLGILTEGDCLKASPSEATSLSKHELYYLLEQIKVKDVMSKKVIAVTPDMLVEEVILVMRKNRIGGVPVVDDGKLVGIITATDLLDSLIDTLGAGQPGIRMVLELVDRPGVLTEIAGLVNEKVGSITSIAEFHNNQNGKVYLLLRFPGGQTEAKMISELLESKGHHVDSTHVLT